MKTGSLLPNGNLRDARTVGEGLLIVLTYMRDRLVDTIFQIFARSISGANKKKSNSLILFILNVREFKSTQKDCLLLSVEVYMKLRVLAKKFIPNFSNIFTRFSKQIEDPINGHRATSKINL